jgi:hypothetical protein
LAAPPDLKPVRPPISPLTRNLLILALVALASVGGWLWFTQARDAVSELNRELQQFRAAGQSGDVLIEQSGADAIATIQRLPGLTLPESASDVHFARQGRTHSLYWLRFSAPAADVDPFLRSSCFTPPLEAGNDPGFEYATSADVIANLEWWTPRLERESSGGRCNPSPDVTFRVAVDQTSADARTVYFEISTGLTLTIPTPDATL